MNSIFIIMGIAIAIPYLLVHFHNKKVDKRNKRYLQLLKELKPDEYLNKIREYQEF